MARELIVWCSRCLMEKDVREPGQGFLVALDGKAVRVLDLCEPCEKDLLTRLREALEDFGESPDRAPVRNKPSPTKPQRGQKAECLICHAMMRSDNLDRHQREVHGVLGVNPGDLTCAVCGRGFGKKQGLSMHLARSVDGPHMTHKRQLGLPSYGPGSRTG